MSTAATTFAAELGPLGFGAAAIGNLYSAVEEETALAAVDEALSCGIRFFDTAPLYGYGLSEARLARALRGVPRDCFRISTKVGRVLEDIPAGQPGEEDMFKTCPARRARFDYSRDGIRASFEASLERLGIQHVDVLLLHDIGRQTHGDRHPEVLRLALDEALPAMLELKASGACRAVGLGVNEEEVCFDVLAHCDLDVVLLAGRYTLLEQTSLFGLMTQAHARGIAVLAAAPFNSGLLSDAIRPGATYDYRAADPTTSSRAQKLYDACALEGVDIGAAALRFPLAHPAVACVVAGLRSADEVKTAARRMTTSIPATLWQRLRNEGLISAHAPVPHS